MAIASINSIEVLVSVMTSLLLLLAIATKVIVHQLLRSLWSSRGWEVTRTSLVLVGAWSTATIASEATTASLWGTILVHLRLVVMGEVALGVLPTEVTRHVVMALADFIVGTSSTLVA